MADDVFVSPREFIALKRASVLHLCDLKRAGCSPKFCELTVDRRTDRVLALPELRPARGRPKAQPIMQPDLFRMRAP
jgi:hypothetical protein